jgi:O-antigen/teichoic acid export membrane protein
MRIRDHLRRLAGESAIYGLPSIISRAVSLLLIPIYTRVFSPSDYGGMSMVDVTIALLASIVVLGLETASYRWYYDTDDIADRKKTISSWLWTQITASTFAGLLLVIVAPWIIKVFINDYGYFLIFLICALTLPVGVPNGVLVRLYRMQHEPKKSVGFSIFRIILTPLLTIWMVVVLKKGVLGIYLADLIVESLAMVASIAILKDWISPFNFKILRLKQMLAFSFPLIPSSIASWVVSVSDRYFVSFYKDLSEVGLYQLGISIASAINIFIMAFQAAWVVFALSIKDKPEAHRVYATVMEVYLLVSCFLALGITLFSPEALRILTTPAYYAAYNVVGLLTLGFIFTELYQIFAIGLSIEKNMKPIGMAISIGAVINVVLNFLLIPQFGRMGAAFATLCTQALISAIIYLSAQKIHHVPYRLWLLLILPFITFLLMTIGQLLSFLPLLAWIFVKLILLCCFLFTGLIIEPIRIYVLSFHKNKKFIKC